MTTDNTYSSLVLFDGYCNLCNASVNFIIKHDTKNRFKFASLQSEMATKCLANKNFDYTTLTSIVLIENNKVYTKSTAVLHIVKQLNGLYPLLYAFVIIPPIIRNNVYDFMARHRYQWFGKRDVCMLPTEAVKAKFIN